MGETNNFDITQLSNLLEKVNSLVKKPIKNSGIEDPKKAISNVVGALEGAIQKTSVELKSSTDETERLKNEINSKQSEIDGLKKQIEDLKKEHEATVNGLKLTSSTNKNNAIRNLKSQQNQTLKNKNIAFTEEKEALNREISTIKSQIVEKESLLSKLTEEKNSLTQEKSELEKKVKIYESQLKKAGSIIVGLKEKVEKYNISYQALEKQITNIYSKYTTNGKTLNTESIITTVTQTPLEVASEGGAKKRVTRKRKSVSKKKQTKPKSKKQTKTKSKRKSVKRN